MRHLHTAVADEIRRAANGDSAMEAEMKAESMEYANEVRGFYDYDDDPVDYDDRDGEPEPDEEEGFCYQCKAPLNEDGLCDTCDHGSKAQQVADGREDFGWDGGREE